MQTGEEAGAHASKLTLGTVQLGIPYGIRNRDGMPSEEDSLALLQEAWDGGVRSYDTASVYGQSETILGKFFDGKSPLLTTKIKIHPEPGATPSTLERAIRGEIESSLKRLNRSSVPIVMLHNTDAMESHGAAVTAAFRAAVREGLIGQAGISVAHNGEDEYRMLERYLRDDAFGAIQLPMNVFDHRPLAGGRFRALATSGKTLFLRSVFLQGLLYMNEEEVPDKLREARKPIAELRGLSERYGVPVAQMAVSFVRDMDGVHSLVIGAETIPQVRGNIALIGGPPLPDELREEILVRFRDVPEKVITPHLWN
ncbi:hypothetical protein DLM86_16910 [Paenibacillus flagellatus]|uniref:NADP-dependent oxidoreductase domain-containing protein n=2 Tax=Paenibacillus flagellatus TaxID=2211139 RepID=A0A2V5K6P3_9BACL|nr:hypothetical protein DLM86_16910 [Paenibacillus flagellatus]